jgi:dipeptidyl aminopeptidase/acylaminoacyl peptidase
MRLSRRTILVLVALPLIVSTASGTDQRRLPTIDDLLNIDAIGSVRISPNGKWVGYSVTHSDLKKDAFVTHIWIADPASGRRYQLTRGDKSGGDVAWSPDSTWLTFTSNRTGDKSQIFAIPPDGGEAVQLTKAETGVKSFQWSPDSKSIAFTAAPSKKELAKNRKEHLGDFEVVRKEYDYQHLWTINVAEALKEPQTGKQRTTGTDYSIGRFSWSPDGSRIAFDATQNPDLIQLGTADIYTLRLADDAVKRIVAQPGPDTNPRWSPDGKQLVFESAMGKPDFFHCNLRLAVIPADGGTPRSITEDFDEDPFLTDWKPGGIYFRGFQKSAFHLFHVDPDKPKVTRLSSPDDSRTLDFSLTHDGRQMAFTAASPSSLSEVFVSEVDHFAPRKLTDMTEQTRSLVLGQSEIISWKSQDGTTIEGVLTKPANFDPAKRRPLLCIIHGGPTGIDVPLLLASRY